MVRSAIVVRAGLVRACSVALLAGILLSSAQRPSDSSRQPSAAANQTTASSYFFYSEVHLRKLHLVRPDLIPYPIHFPTYC